MFEFEGFGVAGLDGGGIVVVGFAEFFEGFRAKAGGGFGLTLFDFLHELIAV
jgi:hypothetical protein